MWRILKKRSVLRNFVLLLCAVFVWVFVSALLYLPADRLESTTARRRIRPYWETVGFQPETEKLLRELPNVEGRNKKLEEISNIIIREVEFVQNKASCNATLSCGHANDCGLGCQLHHRALCLVISFVMGVPLIHDARGSWPYTDPWESVFQPLGSRCVANEGTIYMRWTSGDCPYLSDGSSLLASIFRTKNLGAFPLDNGIPMEKELREVLRENLAEPFLWVVGLFLNYTMKLNPSFEEEYRQWSLKIEGEEPLVGVHVRRTDKILEYKDSYHEIEEYILRAEEIFKNSTNLPRTLYIASDDGNVLRAFQRKYKRPTWNIVGPENNLSRVEGLFSIVKDILFLGEADYVICGMSSNICRLVLELKSYADPDKDARNKVISMDEEYKYPLFAAKHCEFLPTRVV